MSKMELPKKGKTALKSAPGKRADVPPVSDLHVCFRSNYLNLLFIYMIKVCLSVSPHAGSPVRHIIVRTFPARPSSITKAEITYRVKFRWFSSTPADHPCPHRTKGRYQKNRGHNCSTVSRSCSARSKPDSGVSP